MQIVGRAVERIDDPLVIRRAGRAAFLCEYRVPGIGLVQRRMIACSASRSTSETKSFAAFSCTETMSRLRVPRLMMLPARRAAFTAVLSIGCSSAALSMDFGGSTRTRILGFHRRLSWAFAN